MNRNSFLYRALRHAWRRVRFLKMSRTLFADSLYDTRRYLSWSHGTGFDRTERQKRHALYKAYHGVEKGLSLAEPRPNFGAAKVKSLINTTGTFITAHGTAHAAPAVSALHFYDRFNRSHDITNPALDAFLGQHPDDGTGGTETVRAQDLHAIVANVGHDFFWSRHSVRNFSDRPVEMEDIRAAVEMARKTPTVCNRQGVRVHVFEKAQEALDWQPGNRGFGHLASCGLVVTADMQAFSSPGERNQPYVDGGMFSMSLLYALHAQGLGACPLAWSASRKYDREVREALGIPDSEAIIMMIAVGHLPEEFQTARSHRMPLDHFMVVHPAGQAKSRTESSA